MSLRDQDLENVPIYFHKPGEVTVLVGPFTGTAFKGDRIPLDGRHYSCAGRVILRNGLELRADFRIQTHTFDFLEPGGTWCRLGTAWYNISDPELLRELSLTPDQAYPFTWLPDVPLAYHDPGPYPMTFYEESTAVLEENGRA